MVEAWKWNSILIQDADYISTYGKNFHYTITAGHMCIVPQRVKGRIKKYIYYYTFRWTLHFRSNSVVMKV